MAGVAPDWLARHPDPSKVRVAIYARRSKGKGTTYSPREQVMMCLARCKERGWKPAYIVVEDDARADYHRRPKWLLLLWRAKHRKFHVLLTWKTDRWARSLWDTLRTERFLAKHGIAYMSVTEPFDTTTSYGRFSFRSLSNFAELEREINSERGKMGRHNKASQHKWPTRIAPLGYQTRPDFTVEICPEEVGLVTRIWNDYRREKNAPDIAMALNHEGRLTKSGKRYTAREIHRILGNPMYAGVWDQGGVREPAEDLRIFSDAHYKGMQAIRQRRIRRREPMPTSRKLEAFDRMADQYFSLLRESERFERHETETQDLRGLLELPPSPDSVGRLLDQKNPDRKLRRLMAEIVTEPSNPA